MGDGPTFQIRPESGRSFSATAVVFLVFVISLLVAVGYVRHLQAEAEEQARKMAVLEQSKKALSDSLQKVREDSTRALYRNTDTPTTESDTLGESVTGETDRQTTARVDPEADTSSGTAAADRRSADTDTVYVYRVQRKIGRYDLSGTVEVYPPGDRIDYDLTVDGQPFTLNFFHAETGGYRRTFIDAPTSLEVTGLESTYRAPEPEPEFRNWQFHVYGLARPGFGSGFGGGGSARYRVKLFGPVNAFAQTTIETSIPTAWHQTTIVAPEASIGLSF